MKRSRVALAWFLALYGALLVAVRVSGPSGVNASEVSRSSQPARPRTEAGSNNASSSESHLAINLQNSSNGLDYLWNRSGMPIYGPPGIAFDFMDEARVWMPLAKVDQTPRVADRWMRRQLADAAQVEALARRDVARKPAATKPATTKPAAVKPATVAPMITGEQKPTIVLVILAGEASKRVATARTEGFDDAKSWKLTCSLYDTGVLPADTIRPASTLLPPSHAWLNGLKSNDLGRTTALMPVSIRVRDHQAFEFVKPEATPRSHWSVRLLTEGLHSATSVTQHTVASYVESAPHVAKNMVQLWSVLPKASARPTARKPERHARPATRNVRRGPTFRMVR